MVTYGPLSAEMGAAQVALNLSEALSARGHEVVVWSPPPLPPQVRWWQDWIWRRRQLEEYLDAAPPFDAVDLPTIALSRRLARRAPLVARSTQPALQYFLLDAQDSLARAGRSPLIATAQLLHCARLRAAVVRGWHHAAVILCLGTAEQEWMHLRFPWTLPRLAHYFNTVGREEQEELARIRRDRSAPPGSGIRFLWIGRWARHKGTDRLVRFLGQRAASHPRDSFTLAGTGSGGIAGIDALPAGLRDRVRVVPSFPRTGLAELLRSHDAGLFTSTAEGWGLSLNEMLESGLPVFATEAGGVRDLRPYFPDTLLPFPPPLDAALPSGRETDLSAYYRQFTWEAIAERYEADVLHRLRKVTT